MIRNILSLFILIFSAHSLSAAVADSVGLKVVDGKTYIMHKVSKGEGVYGISRKYGVTAKEIYAVNPGSEKTIKIDEILLIPSKIVIEEAPKPMLKEPVKIEQNTTPAPSSGDKIYHTVEKGQTLSFLAREYNTSVNEIKKWNGLESDNINLGQELIVGVKTTATTTPQTPVTPDPNKVSTEEGKKSLGKELPPPTSNNTVVNNNTKVEEEAPAKQVNNKYSTDDGDEINENGTALISSDGDLSQDRSFILHPTAKIGTIVMITNPENNKTVFARVVGNCPKEDGVILKMSQTVANKLGVTESTEVKLSYAK